MENFLIKGVDKMEKDLTKEGVLKLSGNWTVECVRDGKVIWVEKGKNIIPTEGLNHILNVAIGTASKSQAWYIGIFKNNYTPLSTNTAANSLGLNGLYGEAQDAEYDPPSDRPTYTVSSATGGVISNAAAKAEFQIKQALTIYGAFITNTQAKNSTSGVLLAAKKFDTPRNVVSGDIVYVTYEITATSA